MLTEELYSLVKYQLTFIVQLPQWFHNQLKKSMYVTFAYTFLLLLWAPFIFAQQSLPSHGNTQDYILYVPIPSDISKESVTLGDTLLKNRLHSLVKESLTIEKRLLEATEALDRIVIFTEHNGQPILPNLDAARDKRKNISKVPVPFVEIENNLTFTFDSPDYPWSPEELTILNTDFNDFYPIVKTIYGNPAFNITVNVRKDPTIPYAGLYFPSLNEMVIRNALSPDPICHEMIHAFRDDMIINLSSFEEGMTRAAEVEAFNRLPAYVHWDENHSYYYDIYYEGLNNQKIGSQNGDFWRGYVSPLLRYQLGGYAWAKVFLENQDFFADFNQHLYTETLSDSTTTSSESKLLDIATSIQPIVEDNPFLNWYYLQGVLNTNPPKGYILYQRINQLTIDYFYRDPSYGQEIMQPGATIEWTIYDHLDQLLDSGTSITNGYGWAGITTPWPIPYTGRIKVVVSTNSPDGKISDVSYRYAGEQDYNGIFGIIRHADVGSITITPLDYPVSPVSIDVINGAFSAPSLTGAKGRFVTVFENGTTRETKEFNKDASAYFLSILPGSLEAHYTLDEGTGNIAHDSSGNGNDGTINGATWASGKSGSGLGFDGINDYVSIPLLNNDVVSVSAWFNKNAKDTTNADAIFGAYRSNSNVQLREGFDVRFYQTTPDTLQFILVTRDGGGVRTQRTARRNLLNSVGNWYHAAGTYNKTTGEQKLYVNGQLVHTVLHPAGNTVVPMTYYPDMRIGHSRVNNGYFNGAIDDVRLFNRPLSDTEVKTLYNAYASDLQAQYALNEGIGTIANDTSGSGNHGSISGAAWTTGKSGGGLSFDGADDYVSIPRINNDEVSACAWFYKNANDTTRNDAIVGGFRSNSSLQLREGFDVRFPSSAPDTVECVLITQDGSGTRSTRTVRRNLGSSVGSWYHVACTYNKTTGSQRLYVNGLPVHTLTHPAGNTIVPLTFYSDMRIGYSRANTGYFNGILDDVRLYRRALTDQEVLDIYNGL